MGIAVAVLVTSGFLAAWALARSGAEVAQKSHSALRGPLDEAERILAARYAAGSITPQEYQRMLIILRS